MCSWIIFLSNKSEFIDPIYINCVIYYFVFYMNKSKTKKKKTLFDNFIFQKKEL